MCKDNYTVEKVEIHGLYCKSPISLNELERLYTELKKDLREMKKQTDGRIRDLQLRQELMATRLKLK